MEDSTKRSSASLSASFSKIDKPIHSACSFSSNETLKKQTNIRIRITI